MTKIIRLRNGIGDKLLDLLGLFVYSELSGVEVQVVLNQNKQNFVWGNAIYDHRLFDFGNLHVVDKTNEESSETLLGSTAITLSPINISNACNVDLVKVKEAYLKVLSKIKESEIIKECIPSNIYNAIGIHLRKSDKIMSRCPEMKHFSSKNNKDELNDLMENLKEDVIKHIDSPVFVCSEDTAWKQKFEKFVLQHGGSIVGSIVRNDDMYTGFKETLDLFCLSKCKKIIQGTKYSSFSLTAALLGNKPIVNYLLSDASILTHIYRPIIDMEIRYDQTCDTEVDYSKILSKWDKLLN